MNSKLQRDIIIGLTILMIIAIGIKTYQNKIAKENFLNNGVENTNQTRKYDNPKLQSLYNEIEQELKDNHIQVFDLEVKEDENGTIGYFFQYNIIIENKINEIEPRLKGILEKYQNNQTVYQNENQEILEPQAVEHKYQKIIDSSNTQKYYSSDTRQEEKNEYQSKKTKHYSISKTYQDDYVLNVEWDGKKLNILMNENEYENNKQNILERRNLIISNCYDKEYKNYYKYDVCLYSFVD
jgi:hypothetical protein